MKELTHAEWVKNPTPRMMWVWDEDKDEYDDAWHLPLVEV